MGFFSASDRENPSRPHVQAVPRDDAREHLLAIADVLAKALDTTVKIPGTSISIGLDPLLGLIPGIGDALANLIGTVILGLAARVRVPRIVLARMSLNLLINGVVGAIPIAGDLFSVWFQSNMRNAALLRAAAMKPDRETRPDWLYVGGIIGGTVVLMLLAIAFVVWVVAKLWTMIAL
ncbi:MAG: DUF4112 domain-containing protein [Nitrospiraceae bacterium]|jgi:hypothetical protein|nr:DUF4112 domain-containing protein [Nitrospiraceae bacterium]